MTDNALQVMPCAVEHEVEARLAAAGIYKIGSYGWLNENDADPELIGHAMWQTSQPHIEHWTWSGEMSVKRRPNEVEKQILTLGEDFCGLMEASRLSIGLSLLWEQHATRNVLNEPTYFWLHHTDAFLKLAIASDRLRDLLIVACTGTTPEVFKKTSKRNRLYATAFTEARRLVTNRGLNDPCLAEPLELLAQQADAIFAHIDRRNSIVHDVATRMAKHVQGDVAALQQQYDAQRRSESIPKSSTPLDWTQATRDRITELETEIEAAVTELRDWYSLLINASNNVFQVEHWTRVLEAMSNSDA